MTTAYFFGYGSLVNRATHAHDPAHTARLSGWRRVWRHLPARPYATLSVEPSADSQIEGLIAGVAAADWSALDEREAAYARHDMSQQVDHDGPNGAAITMYVVPHSQDLAEPLPILLSYLDVVVQGYDEVFGDDGVEAFFATTRGWDAPVLDDRAAPIYPRHQLLSDTQRQRVDAALIALGSKVARLG